jgi:hypothetical protein
MVEAWGIPINPSAILELNFDYMPGSLDRWGSSSELHTNIRPNTFSAWIDSIDGMQPFAINGYSIAYGDVLEMRIPLSELPGAQYFRATRGYLHFNGSVCDGDWQIGMNIRDRYIQHRKYQNGREFNKLYFTMADNAGGKVGSNIAESVILYDPNGQVVNLIDLGFNTSELLMGNYNADTGKFGYDQNLYIDPAYNYSFDEPLIQGVYHLVVTVTGHPPFEYFHSFTEQVELPIVSAESFDAHINATGDLIWIWKPLQGIDPSLSTSIRAFVQSNIDGINTNKMIWAKLPTHLGYLYVPQNVLSIVRTEGDELQLGIELRTTDNNNRTYSNFILLDQAKGPLMGDFNGDGKVSIEEAIYALKIASGVQPE